MNEYKGECHHTSVWPQQGLNYHGKKVAVIGTGATGVQAIQEIGPHVSHLTVFQRTPNLCLPMRQQPLDVDIQLKDKATYASAFKLRLETFAGFTFGFRKANIFDDTPEARRAFYEELWERGGFHFWLSTYQDMFFDKKGNDTAYDFWREKTCARLTSTAMKDKLAPQIAPHTFGTKRPSLEQRYLEVFNQPTSTSSTSKQIPSSVSHPQASALAMASTMPSTSSSLPQALML
jgi:cation diffusion facilitator CzcD-associated flavoprotein CzcO